MAELLKYFLMMAISTNNNSLLKSVEDDWIEKSNLIIKFYFEIMMIYIKNIIFNKFNKKYEP